MLIWHLRLSANHLILDDPRVSWPTSPTIDILVAAGCDHIIDVRSCIESVKVNSCKAVCARIADGAFNTKSCIWLCKRSYVTDLGWRRAKWSHAESSLLFYLGFGLGIIAKPLALESLLVLMMALQILREPASNYVTNQSRSCSEEMLKYYSRQPVYQFIMRRSQYHWIPVICS